MKPKDETRTHKGGDFVIMTSDCQHLSSSSLNFGKKVRSPLVLDHTLAWALAMSGISTAPGPPVRRSGEYMASLPSDLAPPITTHNLGPTQISPHITHSTYTPASVAEVYPSQSSSYHTLPAATYTYTPPTTTNIATPPTQTIARNDTDLPPLIQHRPDVLREYDEIYDEEAHRRALEVETHEKELELERKKERERLVSGLDNDDLNALLRAFDKVGTGLMFPADVSNTGSDLRADSASKSKTSTFAHRPTMDISQLDSTSTHRQKKSFRWTKSGAVWRGFTLPSGLG